MRWDQMRESSNVEDRRGGGGLPLIGGGLGIVGTLAVIGISLLLGVNPLDLLSMSGGGQPVAQQQTPTDPNDPAMRFVRSVVGDTEDTWQKVFAAQLNAQYQPPRLVVFRGQVESACGRATSAVGPFYCPADRQVYLDLAFFDELSGRFKAPGDFANAYVIAHEIGHHVQTLTGISQQVQQAGQAQGKAGRNALSVRQELQADCLAGVWGHYAAQRKLLDPGDAEEAFAAAQAIGDDTLQKQAQGYAVPDSFTHGTSAQRLQWFRTGLQTGQIRSCDTFSGRESATR